ncbi:Spy/CpxP family protein refolding chaperone [Jiella marina]|uniref:Spy/CpxP family protein refolding chaperone n=1 Tax=Jiella sp. LLJ827 TaxID=2917712 RepID=UPI002101D494|nr:hypothetical protein [Jiella sp. LLJ827]MCQ0986214.1 hypothetical protein [Jiella sp. LLJ827]
MIRFWLAGVAAMISLPQCISAQTVDAQQPYADIQSRAIKALSDEEIADLRAGRGMGFALPAELNGYPGPRHVLDFAEKLGLTEDQKDKTEALFASMEAETIPLGMELISQEEALDRMFAEKTADPTSLSNATALIGETQGELRAAHLRYHIEMTEFLTPHQMRIYAKLRGYDGPSNGSQHGSGSHAH